MALLGKRPKIDEILGSRVKAMSERETREVIWLILPLVLLAAASIWMALQFAQPAPPKRIVISTGSPSGAYFAFGRSDE